MHAINYILGTALSFEYQFQFIQFIVYRPTGLQIPRMLRLMHDGISFDKILLKQVGYLFWYKNNWKQP
jgi:hypothetical protein